MLLVTATIYHATPEQTDSTPHITASGKRIDFLVSKKLKGGKWENVTIEIKR